MFLNSQNRIVCLLLLIIEFKTYLGQETSSLQADGTVYARTIDSRISENSLTAQEVQKTVSTDPTTSINKNNLHNEDANSYNKSIEYWIEDPNTANGRHEQEVIIKPLNYFKNQPTSLLPLAESSQNRENQSTTVITNITESQMDKQITLGNEKKEVLIINLLNSQNQLLVREAIPSLMDSQKEEVREALRQIEKNDHDQQLSLNTALNTDNQASEIETNKVLNPQNQLLVRESIPSLKDSQKEEVRESLRQTDQTSVAIEKNDHEQQLLFNGINTDNQASEMESNKLLYPQNQLPVRETIPSLKDSRKEEVREFLRQTDQISEALEKNPQEQQLLFNALNTHNQPSEVQSNKLLNPQNQLLVRESIPSLKNSRKEEVREALRQTDQTSVAIEKNDHEQQLLFNGINTDNQASEMESNKPLPATEEMKEDMIFKPINMIQQYLLNTEEEITTSNYNREISTTTKNNDKEDPDTFIDYKKDSSIQKPLATNETNDKVVETIVQSSNTATSASESSEENKDLTPKPVVSLEDYAVKQMDFILDHMLLESQEFVAKVLQATGNTLFHRDPLKRYAENLNHLLNPQIESDYSDEIYIPTPPTMQQQDIYEDVIKKINFLKSKTTKELQRHLPANWIKEYQNKKEELKIWLNKASDEMHRVFNFYVDDEEDHIRYLYFNEAFDDVARATEIHQKLALLADLIKIVKNKKQITFMDLYMQ